jgi:hypothetical protein
MNETTKSNLDKNRVYGVIAVLVILVLVAWAAFSVKDNAGKLGANNPVSIPKANILNNAAYHFEITAPIDSNSSTTFKKYYALSDTWRANAPSSGAGSKGTPVLAISLFSIDQQNGSSTGGANEQMPERIYPLSFAAEVRIGVSSSTATCYNKDEGYTTQKAVDVEINGVKFKKFSFHDAAMMKYVQGESYRTIHNNLCYAIEQIKTGSTYRDDTMKGGFTDEELNLYYEKAGEIIKTFKFTS